jgi:hypothetical protein
MRRRWTKLRDWLVGGSPRDCTRQRVGLVKRLRAGRFARIGHGHPRRAPQRFHHRRGSSNGELVEVLCEDHVGTYLLPFPCRSTPEGLRNAELLQVRAVGWRRPAMMGSDPPVPANER